MSQVAFPHHGWACGLERQHLIYSNHLVTNLPLQYLLALTSSPLLTLKAWNMCSFFQWKRTACHLPFKKILFKALRKLCDNMCSTKPKAGPSPTSWHYLTLHSTNQPSSGYCGYPVPTIHFALFPDKFFYYLILGSILPDSSSEKYMKLNSTCPVLYK